MSALKISVENIQTTLNEKPRTVPFKAAKSTSSHDWYQQNKNKTEAQLKTLFERTISDKNNVVLFWRLLLNTQGLFRFVGYNTKINSYLLRAISLKNSNKRNLGKLYRLRHIDVHEMETEEVKGEDIILWKEKLELA